jgi:hypothetical protein
MDHAVDRVMASYENLPALERLGREDIRVKVGQYLAKLSPAGHFDAEELTFYGLSTAAPDHGGSWGWFTAESLRRCAFACPAALHPIWPKRDLDRVEFRAPAQPEREASLFPAEKSDRFCGA